MQTNRPSKPNTVMQTNMDDRYAKIIIARSGQSKYSNSMTVGYKKIYRIISLTRDIVAINATSFLAAARMDNACAVNRALITAALKDAKVPCHRRTQRVCQGCGRHL